MLIKGLEIEVNSLQILPTNTLLKHEQTIPENTTKLKEAMLNIGQLVDPIIADKQHKIVLDGNHRLEVLKMIKVPLVVCQTVDYSRPDITLGGWFPVRENLSEADLKKAGIRFEKTDFEAGQEALARKKAVMMLVNEGKGKRTCALVSPGSYDLTRLIEEQRIILSKLGNNFLYIADDRIETHLTKGQGALFRAVYTKEEVIKRALSGVPFPPKSTRHIIPERIIRLNMRLGWLHQSEDEAKKYLERMLEDRLYNGNIRRYTEPVIVIY